MNIATCFSLATHPQGSSIEHVQLWLSICLTHEFVLEDKGIWVYHFPLPHHSSLQYSGLYCFRIQCGRNLGIFEQLLCTLAPPWLEEKHRGKSLRESLGGPVKPARIISLGVVRLPWWVPNHIRINNVTSYTTSGLHASLFAISHCIISQWSLRIELYYPNIVTRLAWYEPEECSGSLPSTHNVLDRRDRTTISLP